MTKEEKKAYDAAWSSNHRSERAAYAAKWRESNPEKAAAYQAAYQAAYRAAHREERKAYCAAWRAENPVKAKASSDSYRALHPHKVKESCTRWRARNPERVKRWVQRRRAKQHQSFVEDVDILILYERDKGLCGICGKKVKKVNASLDHIIPLAKGGDHSYKNTQVSHKRCNTSKGARAIGQQTRMI